MTVRQWELVHEDRPMLENEHRRLHYHARATYDRLWRHTFAWLARQKRIGHLDAVLITVVQECRRGTTLPDPGNSFPTAKAAIDGLRDAGVLTDDSGKFVKALVFTAPTHGPKDRFILVIEEYFEAEAASA